MLLNIGFILTYRCDKACNYCKLPNVQYDPDGVQLRFLERVLEDLPKPMRVEISGGEPGMVSNIDDVLNIIDSSDKILHIDILSNGRIRNYTKLNQLKKLDRYKEHVNVEDIGKNYDEKLPLEYIVVLEDKIMNMDITPYLSYPVEWKFITPKVEYPTDEYVEKAINFYKQFDPAKTHPFTINKNKYHLEKTIHQYMLRNKAHVERACCAHLPERMFIEFPTKTIGHCSMNVCESSKQPYSKQTLWKALSGLVFSKESHCANCYKYNVQYTREHLFKI